MVALRVESVIIKCSMSLNMNSPMLSSFVERYWWPKSLRFMPMSMFIVEWNWKPKSSKKMIIAECSIIPCGHAHTIITLAGKV